MVVPLAFAVLLGCAGRQPARTPQAPPPPLPGWMLDYTRSPANVRVLNTCPVPVTVTFVDPTAGAVLASRYLATREDTLAALPLGVAVEMHVRLHNAENSVYDHGPVGPSVPPVLIELSGQDCAGRAASHE